ncbi:VOC family protein [Beduini massiliensis]|uniref:VOC family protein n=1 Tax=Beduini massiliensis TaxID=1585974 RepID=UPI00059A9E97|nr:glyoxalase/bleomycin resistance/dioxygenase family protein [Beduini massiliensis]
MNCRLYSLYLCVKNMDRAVSFYKDFFEKSPLIEDEIYSVFDLDGFRLGLFAYQKVGEDHMFGSNCLPSLEVDNLNILQDKIKNLEICFPLTKIKNNWVIEFVDSEGNHIELTTPVSTD